jgi:alkylation response protein AidB-like acyl-CoA dehydrogenase
MTMTDTLVLDAADRLFADQATPALVNAAENGTWPNELWQASDEAGFPDALGELADLPGALAILRAAGRHAVPLPLAETILARFALRAAGAPVPTGPLTLAPVERDDVIRLRRDGDAWQLSGVARGVPWSREARAIVILADGMTALVAPGQTTARRATNLAGEPRDNVDLTATLADDAVKAMPQSVDRDLVYRLGALCRAAQMAGALEAALALATQYANDRVQFGRPIGKFQAIQQQLAQFAEQVAAATVAVTASADEIARGGDVFFAAAIAKIRAGEAAGKSADIAHQVHGAIGFTHEHRLHHLTRRLWSWRDEFGVESEWSIALGRRVAAEGAEAFWPSLTS